MADISRYPIVEDLSSSDQLLTFRSNSGQTVRLPLSVLTASFPDQFTKLSDTPGSYLGRVGETLAVNSAETGLEFVPNNLSPTYITLPDTPLTFAGEAGKFAKVNGTSNAIEFGTSSFIGNADTPPSYSGLAGALLRINAGETGIEFFPDTGEIPNVQIINDEADLAPVNGAGEHELLSGVAYWFTGAVALANPVRSISQSTEIYGNGAAQSVVTYSGTGAAFRGTGGASLRLRQMGVVATIGDGIEYLAGGGPGSGDVVSFERVSITANAGTALAVNGTDQFVADTCGLISATPVVFSGTCGLFDITNSLCLATSANPDIDFGTAVFNTIAMSNCALEGVPGTVGMSGLASNGNLSATGSARVDGTSFGTSVTQLSGITTEDTKWRFTGNVNLADSNSLAFAYITTPATTAILAADTDYQVAGTWTAQAETERATVAANGEVEFFNIEEEKGSVSATFTAVKVGGGTGSYTFKVQKNPNGAGWADIEAITKTVTLTTTTSSITILGIAKHVVSDEFRLVVRGNGTTDDVDVSVTQFVIGA